MLIGIFGADRNLSGSKFELGRKKASADRSKFEPASVDLAAGVHILGGFGHFGVNLANVGAKSTSWGLSLGQV